MRKFDPALFMAMTGALKTLQRPRAIADPELFPSELRGGGIKAFDHMEEYLTTLGLKASAGNQSKLF